MTAGTGSGSRHGAGAPEAGLPDGHGPEAEFDAALCGVHGPLEEMTFEQLLAALEAVTARLASSELGIEAAAALYEQAEILHAAAGERLAAVEARIARLHGPGDLPGVPGPA